MKKLIGLIAVIAICLYATEAKATFISASVTVAAPPPVIAATPCPSGFVGAYAAGVPLPVGSGFLNTGGFGFGRSFARGFVGGRGFARGFAGGRGRGFAGGRRR